MTTDKSKEALAGFLLLGTACCAFLFLYLPMVNNWFYNDDLQWIWSSSNTSWKEIFFVPQTARGMAPFFTPMLAVSFKIDWNLFGINPIGYAAHSLLLLVAASIVLYLFIRLYTQKNAALIGVSLFLLNPSTVEITSWFSARHYLEGLFFALLSLYFFVRAERKGAVSVASGIFYLLASLDKELYVVLPAIAFLVSGGNLFKRMKNTIPLWVGLFIYALWRYAIMRGMGGYTMMQSLSLQPSFLYHVIKLFSVNWFGDYYMLGYLFLSAAFLLSLKNIRMLFIFLILLIPIIPLGVKLEGGHYSGRYLFHMSVFMICAVSLFVQYRAFGNKLIHRITPFVVSLFLAVMFVKQDVQISNHIRQERAKARKEAAALLISDKPYIKSDLFLSGFYDAYKNIYRAYFGTDIKTRFVPPEDSLIYCSPERLREIIAAGINIPYDEILTMQKKLRKGPISIRITLCSYKLSWKLGPDKNGAYIILPGDLPGLYYGRVPVPPAGSLMIGKNPGDGVRTIYFRIFHETGDREKVISPEFMIRLPGTQTIEYRYE